MFSTAMATIKEVARRARVSVGTVSNVLSGAIPVSDRLRQRVLQVVRDLDYHPNHVARSLKLRQTKMLGMVVTDITNPFFPQLVRGAEDAAWKYNYILITFNTDEQLERERQVLSALRTRRVDGIALVAASSDGDLSHIRGTIEAAIPIVAVDRAAPGMPLDSLSVDNVAGAELCVTHLTEGGRRRIGILTGPLTLQVARERLEGYRRALAAAGLPYDESLVRDGAFRLETGRDASLELLRFARPDAVFTCNAVMALGLFRALNELNLKCPRDVAVATFDDPPFAEALQPSLTAVAHPSYDLGYQAIELLIRRIQEPGRKLTTQRLPARLVIRQSSASALTASGTRSAD
jgi:LacI family transcriptional regulator